MVLNYLNYCFLEKLLISLSNLKESLAAWSIFGCRLFSFITLNKSCLTNLPMGVPHSGDLGLIPGLGRSFGEGIGYPLQYSVLENSMDSIVHGVAELDATE